MTHRHVVHIVKLPSTWILVADAKRAQIYTRRKMEKLIPLAGNMHHGQFEKAVCIEPVPLPGMAWEAQPLAEYETGRNATGMVFESATTSRSMSEPHMDARDEIRINFARTIANELNHAKERKAFDRLVLIAPPKMLGEIKRHLSSKTLKQVVAEMPKDLTHCDSETLANHLSHMV